MNNTLVLRTNTFWRREYKKRTKNRMGGRLGEGVEREGVEGEEVEREGVGGGRPGLGRCMALGRRLLPMLFSSSSGESSYATC